ncbi:MAG: zinc ribbon domain-containing protein [Promethearchaeota archaeon]
MKYEKNSYVEGFSFCSLIIAGAFLYWGINGIIGGGLWNIIQILIGLSILVGQFSAFTNKPKLRNIVLSEFEQNPNISIDEITKNTGISYKDIKAIIMDLKGSGRLRGTFSSTTGKMQLAEIKKQPEKASKVIVTTSEDNRFCKECGTEVDKNDNAQFCPYCGSKIER